MGGEDIPVGPTCKAVRVRDRFRVRFSLRFRLRVTVRVRVSVVERKNGSVRISV